VGEFVEREDAALGQVRPDGLESIAGGLVKIEVKIGQRDDGVGIVRQVLRKVGTHVSLDDELLPPRFRGSRRQAEFEELWAPKGSRRRRS
jgi:hypothetical protein